MSTDTDWESHGGALTELLSDIETPSDAELISRVRGGDVAAYGELFSRHVEAANRLGRQLARGPDVDDLVAEAFAKVLQVLQGGGGPDVAFRAYLLTAVRRLHVDRVRASSKLQTSDDMTQFDPGIPFQDTAVADFENGAAAKAFASLPERWQLVLWHLEVEGQKPADIAPLLGMSANSVSALAYRAREGLRQAFLTMHLADISAENCRWVNEHLGAYVRKGLSRRDSTKVENHLDECRRCMAMYLELTEVNSNLAGIIAPLLLGAAAASYCASTGTAAGLTGVSALIGRARDFVAANAGASTAGAVAAGVAAVAAAGVMVLGPDTARVISADQPFSETTSLPNTTPAEVPPVEVEERTTPERRDASVDETTGVAEGSADEQAEVVGEPVLDPPASGAGDVDDAPGSETVDQPGGQPGNGPGSDGPGTDGPGSDGPGTDGPGSDGPGTGGPGSDDPGTDGPGSDGPGSDGPGTDRPGGPGTDGPGPDEPSEDPPPTNPGPGPEENPGSQPPGGSDDDDTDTDGPEGEDGGDTGTGDDGSGDDGPNTPPPPADSPPLVVDPPPVTITPPPPPPVVPTTPPVPATPPVVVNPEPVVVNPPVTSPVQFALVGEPIMIGSPPSGGNGAPLYQFELSFIGVPEGEPVHLELKSPDQFCLGDLSSGCEGDGDPIFRTPAAPASGSVTTTITVWLPNGGSATVNASIGTGTSIPILLR